MLSRTSNYSGRIEFDLTFRNKYCLLYHSRNLTSVWRKDELSLPNVCYVNTNVI